MTEPRQTISRALNLLREVRNNGGPPRDWPIGRRVRWSTDVDYLLRERQGEVTPIEALAKEVAPMTEQLLSLRDQHQLAVHTLGRIYARYHLSDDGGAGKLSGEALRALGIDPDAYAASLAGDQAQ